MIFLPNKNKEKKHARLLLPALFFFVLFGFVVFVPAVRKDVSSFFIRGSAPFFKGAGNVKSFFGDFAAYFSSKKEIGDENARLKERNIELENRFLIFESLEKENNELKSAFSRIAGEYVLAGIVSRPPYSPYDILVVDAGSNSGVKEDADVITYDNLAVGKVVEVYPRFSKIKMISFPGNETSVVFEKATTSAMATGRGGGNMEVHLPFGVEIKSGEIVLSEGAFQKVIGVVGKIEVNLADPFQTVYFKLPFNIAELQRVFIKKD